jgi:DinB superfamily
MREASGRPDAVNWAHALVDQLEFYWDAHLWPRLQGLSDEEFLWEPVAGCWSLRRGPDGTMALDGATPEPTPPPMTTIAWRLVHVAVGCFHTRASTFFGDGRVPADADMFDPRHEPARLPATAAEGLALLESSYRWWHDGIAALDDAAMAAPLGPRGAFFAAEPMAALVLHVNRETMHHGGEIGVLRDLYRARTPADR